ncbi:MAG: flagellar hook protein [Lachnospiraceae bacterium]|nr:flagellar hook protein [Lachnospiraceae bacterium]
MVVQHNLKAMNSNRMLGLTQKAQAASSEKLSSGYKINRGADDAAGLAISEKMRKQIRGLTQASTNAEDGISAVQTAEGALNEIHDMLQRMNELATKAANGTNSVSDRQAIQNEVDALTTEIDRVSETTKFNETYLLHGGVASKKTYMQGHDAGLKGSLIDTATKATFILSAKSLTFGATINIGGRNFVIGSVFANAAAAQSYLGDKLVTGLTAKIDGKNYTIVADYGEFTGKQTLANAANAYTVDDAKAILLSTFSSVVVNGVTYKGVSMTDMNGSQIGIDRSSTSIITVGRALKLITMALKQANSIGVDDAKVVKVSFSGALASAQGQTGASGVTMLAMQQSETGKMISFTITKGYAETQDNLNFALHVGADADGTNKIAVEIGQMSAKGLGIRGISVLDDSGAAGTYAMDAIADAIQKVSDQRAALGAVQNRLEHTIKNLDNVVENTTSAESTIRDTDMASEMVKFSNNNILAQAGQSMLAQANQSNQGVLSLLG